MAAKKKATRKTPAKKKVARKPAGKKVVRKAAKKKVVRKAAKKKVAAKKTVGKATKKKAIRKKAASARNVDEKKPAASGARQPAAKKAAVRKSRPMPLGRPKVTLDSKLEQLFLRDLEIREICEFLGVTTLRDLEQYRADEIIERLTAPVVNTVSRIRKSLAMANRCLKGDQKFARDFKKQVEAQMKQSRR